MEDNNQINFISTIYFIACSTAISLFRAPTIILSIVGDAELNEWLVKFAQKCRCVHPTLNKKFELLALAQNFECQI